MTSPVSAIEAMPRRFSNDRNTNGLGYSNGVIEDEHGYYVLHSDYEALARQAEALQRESAELRKMLERCAPAEQSKSWLPVRLWNDARALLGGENAE